MQHKIGVMVFFSVLNLIKCGKEHCMYLKVNNKILLHGAFLIKRHSSLSQCAKLCWQYTICASISYLRTDLECQLNFINDTLTSFQNHRNGLYIATDDFLKYGLIDKPRYPCSTSQRHIVTKNNSNVCVPFEIDNSRNAALHKLTAQISTYAGSAIELSLSSLAVDGKWTSKYRENGCSHTTTINDPWWYVDLGSPNLITKIVILNRADSNGGRFRDITVYYGLGLDSLRVYGNFLGPGQDGQQVIIKNDNYALGRFVKIVKTGHQTILNFCEVAVYVPNI